MAKEKDRSRPWWHLPYLYLLIFLGSLEIQGVDLALAISFWGAVLLAWPLFIILLWPHIQQAAIESLWLRVVIAIVLVLIASLLYLLRRFRRTTYGIAEMIIGFSTCIPALGNSESGGLTVGIALSGAVYVMVRGIDNFVEGKKLEEEEGKLHKSAREEKEMRARERHMQITPNIRTVDPEYIMETQARHRMLFPTENECPSCGYRFDPKNDVIYIEQHRCANCNQRL